MAKRKVTQSERPATADVDLVTLREAAILLEISEQWTRDLIAKGELDEQRFGIGRGVRLFRRADVEALKQKRAAEKAARRGAAA